MESPVRILLGITIVVNLLLLTATTETGDTLSNETTSTTLKEERNSRHARFNNSTRNTRTKSKLPDVALNELNPKITSEEQTEKNAKYKDRGRVRFGLQSKPITVTESSLKRGSPNGIPMMVIVTPTPVVKKPAQIIDSMRNYKKNKMPIKIFSSTASSVSASSETENEEGTNIDDAQEETESYEKYTSSKFHDSNFFSFPSFENDNYNNDKPMRGSEKEINDGFSTPFSFSSFFPKTKYDSKEDSFKSSGFFDFDSELTTPKNDIFDKKYQEISSSILNNLNSIKSNSPLPSVTNMQNIVEKNIGIEKMNNSTPSNKSTMFIKNTKEIRFLDNDKAGTSNQKLSDVHGTSIYYEMTVLSTESYNINSSGDDCDNDTTQSETTSSTPPKIVVEKSTQPSLLENTTKPNLDFSTMSSNFFPVTILPPNFSSFPTSAKYYISSTESSNTPIGSFNRNQHYPKRMNLKVNNYQNSVTRQSDRNTLSPAQRQQTRRFYQTTPKAKPIWMAPGKLVNRTSQTKVPMTIYSEHFDIKDKLNITSKPIQPSKPNLTTSPSEIDPVMQNDVGGTKKIVHSASISDNTIPSLWKRGSTKYSTSTTTSAEEDTSLKDLEIPPTLTAWALASLRSPPPLSNSAVNSTRTANISVEDNKLQSVEQVLDKKETITTPIMDTTNISRDSFKNISEIDQNKLPWKPITSATTAPSELEVTAKTTESNSERLPAESNISLQNSEKPSRTESIKTMVADITSETSSIHDISNSASDESDVTEASESSEIKAIPPVDATKSTGFESITKLPSGVTTPKDEIAVDSEEKNEVIENNNVLPTTTDYEITTIRFSYTPTEPKADNTNQDLITDWHPIFPTRTKPTLVQENVVTTYRPKYITTTEINEETTTDIIDITPDTPDISLKVVENVTKKENYTLPLSVVSTVTTKLTNIEDKRENISENISQPKDTATIETTTIIVSVATEINTEKGSVSTTDFTTTFVTEIEDTQTDISNSEENSNSNEVITQENKMTSPPLIEPSTKFDMLTTTEFQPPTSTIINDIKKTTEANNIIVETTTNEDFTVDVTTKSVNDLEDLTDFAGDMTTEASSRVLADEAGSGAAIAIAVSTIGVIALVLLIGLLVIVRRRGRRGVYAQRCTPVSLDAYSLDSVSVGQRKGNHRLRASKRSYGNPAYDDEVTSHPMNFAALANFALDIDSITAEFAEIPSISVRPEEVPPGCEDKNRYSNVLPLPETRVPLHRIGNDPTTEYINANFVTGPGNIRNYYILCQAPLANTVLDFWRMIWEQNSRVIVMLTEYMENGVEKCYEYLPPSEISDNKRTFGHFQIILKKREQRDKYAISSIQLINLATRTWREVTQLWYFWPAKGVPDDYDSVIDFLFEMRSYMKVSQTAKEYDEEGVEIIYEDQNRSSYNNLTKLRSEENGSSNGLNVYSPSKAEEKMRRDYPTYGTLGKMKAASEIENVRPCVVVCASGAGRSAALVVADECARALAAGRADLPRAVRRLRTQRPHSLSNKHHYIFLYKLLSEYGNKLMGGGVDTI